MKGGKSAAAWQRQAQEVQPRAVGEDTVWSRCFLSIHPSSFEVIAMCRDSTQAFMEPLRYVHRLSTARTLLLGD